MALALRFVIIVVRGFLPVARFALPPLYKERKRSGAWNKNGWKDFKDPSTSRQQLADRGPWPAMGGREPARPGVPFFLCTLTRIFSPSFLVV